MSSRKNPNNYAMLHNMLGTQVNKYKTDWTDLWGVQNGGVRESFFVSYAMNGAVVDKSNGNRAGLPVRHNLCNSPVDQPSPLNAEYKINCDKRYNGVL